VEAADLAGGLTVQPVDDGDLDPGVGDAQAGQLGGEGPREAVRVGRGADDQDLGPVGVWRTWYSTSPRSRPSRDANTIGWTTWPPG
jgi:hypothetical protein